MGCASSRSKNILYIDELISHILRNVNYINPCLTKDDWDNVRHQIDINVSMKVDELITALHHTNINPTYMLYTSYIEIAKELCKLLIKDQTERKKDSFQCIFQHFEILLSMKHYDDLLFQSLQSICSNYKHRISLATPYRSALLSDCPR
jgi:hypothetical protein